MLLYVSIVHFPIIFAFNDLFNNCSFSAFVGNFLLNLIPFTKNTILVLLISFATIFNSTFSKAIKGASILFPNSFSNNANSFTMYSSISDSSNIKSTKYSLLSMISLSLYKLFRYSFNLFKLSFFN